MLFTLRVLLWSITGLYQVQFFFAPVTPMFRMCVLRVSQVCRTCLVSIKERNIYETCTKHIRNMYETLAHLSQIKPGPELNRR